MPSEPCDWCLAGATQVVATRDQPSIVTSHLDSQYGGCGVDQQHVGGAQSTARERQSLRRRLGKP
jgi:hypothetical protein